MNIALSQRVFYHKGRAYDSIEHGWYSYLKGHTLTYIPNTLEQNFQQLAENLDAFIITGGDDSAIRRTTELKLASSMMSQQKPVVGICHGCFLLVDVLGGKVVEIENHTDTDHDVEYFGQHYSVNSHHSLAIAQLHDSAKVLATDSDRHPEAWIDGNLAGIVWHPERMAKPWIPSEIQNLLKV